MTGCEKVNLDGHAIEFLQHAGERMNLLRIGNAKRIILVSEQRKWAVCDTPREPCDCNDS